MDTSADATRLGGVDEHDLDHAREQERIHRELQHQGGAGRDDRPPAQRERDHAVDEAMTDVRRAEREAVERRHSSAIDDGQRS